MNESYMYQRKISDLLYRPQPRHWRRSLGGGGKDATSISIPPAVVVDEKHHLHKMEQQEPSEEEDINNDLLDEEEVERNIDRILARLPPIRKRFYEFFELQTTFWAKCFGVLVGISIVASIAMVLAESVYEFQTHFLRQFPRFRFVADLIFMNVFLVELAGKFIASPNRLNFFLNVFNFIDLICLIPYFVELFVPVPFFANPFVRILRLLRVLRLLRGFNPSRGSTSIRITARTIRHSVPQIGLVVGYLIIFMVISASFLFVAELEQIDPKTGKILRTGQDGVLTESPFQNIPSTFYWALTTLTTTGYGDQTPVSFWGKLIANLTMVCGVMVFALPATIIGSIYSRVTFQARLRKSQERMEELSRVGKAGKVERVKLLQQQHETILFAIEEFQERLCEVNPPLYYRKYKEVKELYEQTLDRLSALEADYNFLLKEFTQISRISSTVVAGVSKEEEANLRNQSRNFSPRPPPPPHSQPQSQPHPQPYSQDLLQPRNFRFSSTLRRRSSSQSSTRRLKRASMGGVSTGGMNNDK